MWQYQVAGWDEWFESAKSKGYKHKSQCYTPNKHGLGYLRLVKRPNGPALFGAWRAMADVLSRQTAPRHGYLTDTGLPEGVPLTPSDFAALTSMPEELFVELFSVCASPEIGWIITDTIGIPQYPPGIPDHGKGKGNGDGKGDGGEEVRD